MLVILGIRGRVGDLVFKKYRCGKMVTTYPVMSQAGCSVFQHLQHDYFQQAVQNAKAIMSNPEQKRHYEKLSGKSSARHKALAA